MIFPSDPESIGRLYAAWALRAGQPDASDDDITAFAAVKSAILLGAEEERHRFHLAVERAVRERLPNRDRAAMRRAWGMIHRVALRRLPRQQRRPKGETPAPDQR